MSNPFDDLTLAEVEELTETCLNGKSFQDSDAFTIAGAVLYMTKRRATPDLAWKEFRETTRMAEIKAFSELINEDETNPTNGVTT